MSDDSDPAEEPTPSDGPDGAGAADAGDGESGTADAAASDERDDGAGDADGVSESVDESTTRDEGDSADESSTDGEPTRSDSADGNGVSDGTDDDGAADGTDGSSPGVDPPSRYAPADGPAGASGDGLDGRTEESSIRDPTVDDVERPAGTGAGPSAEGAATGDGGVEEAAVSAAEKGMDAVNDGLDAIGGGSGPESDQEMPLTDHIEEMMRRLSVVFAVGLVVSIAVLFVGSVSPTVPSAPEIIRFFWDAHIGYQEYQPHIYGPLEFLLTQLKVAGLAGLLVGLPVFVSQTYLFMRPGLYPNERRYYLAAIPTSFVLGVVGAVFAHLAVLPFVFDYFIGYTRETAIIAFGLSDTFNLILLMMGYFAIVFQIPLFMQLAIMMNVVSRQWMEDRRLLFWGAFLGLAFTFIAADPTGFASIIVAATMIVLFEATLALLRWTGN